MIVLLLVGHRPLSFDLDALVNYHLPSFPQNSHSNLKIHFHHYFPFHPVPPLVYYEPAVPLPWVVVLLAVDVYVDDHACGVDLQDVVFVVVLPGQRGVVVCGLVF